MSIYHNMAFKGDQTYKFWKVLVDGQPVHQDLIVESQAKEIATSYYMIADDIDIEIKNYYNDTTLNLKQEK